jgi:hypothetical protein
MPFHIFKRIFQNLNNYSVFEYSTGKLENAFRKFSTQACMEYFHSPFSCRSAFLK